MPQTPLTSPPFSSTEVDALLALINHNLNVQQRRTIVMDPDPLNFILCI